MTLLLLAAVWFGVVLVAAALCRAAARADAETVTPRAIGRLQPEKAPQYRL